MCFTLEAGFEAGSKLQQEGDNARLGSMPKIHMNLVFFVFSVFFFFKNQTCSPRVQHSNRTGS